MYDVSSLCPTEPERLVLAQVRSAPLPPRRAAHPKSPGTAAVAAKVLAATIRYQETPNAPHVNMNRMDNRGKPVEWQAGVVVRKGTAVRTDTKSARAGW